MTNINPECFRGNIRRITKTGRVRSGGSREWRGGAKRSKCVIKRESFLDEIKSRAARSKRCFGGSAWERCQLPEDEDAEARQDELLEDSNEPF